MAEGYDNTNRGVLFKNDRKEEGDNKPNYTGEINVDGVDKRLAAWIRDSKDGSKRFLSIAVNEKEEQGQQGQQQGGGGGNLGDTASGHADFDQDFKDDIPF